MSKGDLFKVKCENINNKKFNSIQYHLLRLWYRFCRSLGIVLAMIFNRPIQLHRFFYFNLEVTYYRKILMLDMIWFNQQAYTILCPNCGTILYKGRMEMCAISTKCPKCGININTTPIKYKEHI